MSKLQNRSIRNRRRQENMIPQQVNNDTIKDLMDSEGDENLVSETKRKTIKIV
jgi:hypothetical protein